MTGRLAPIPRNGPSIWRLAADGIIDTEHVHENGVVRIASMTQLNTRRPPLSRCVRLPSILTESIPLVNPRVSAQMVSNSNELMSVIRSRDEETAVSEKTPQAKKTRTVHKIPPCVVCLQHARNLACKPCYHLCVCTSCSDRLDACPICRQRLSGCQRIYIP